MDETFLSGGEVSYYVTETNINNDGHIRLVMKTPEQGGDTVVHAVVDPDLPGQGGGLHLENHRPGRVSSFCGSKLNQEKLWSNTCALLQIEKFGSVQ